MTNLPISALSWTAPQQELLACLDACSSAEETLDWLADRSPIYGPLAPEKRVDEHQIKACLSGLWIERDDSGPLPVFRVWSPSKIVFGVSSLLTDLYSDHTPDDISAIAATIVPTLNLERLLSVTRRNSIAHIRAFVEGSR